ncbi:MAG: LysR family transcriptional regulator [Sphingomonadales bacterium]|nr:LysR family transcriptional regulator [Sphingomonadales bacterium]
MSSTPPPVLLQTVEAVVRLGSFKRAADELLITPSAVSHRIRSLEALAGQPLFIREGQGIRPTEEAVDLAAIIERANLEVAERWRGIVSRAARRHFQIQAMAAFAEHFIFGRMADFKRRFPTFDIALTSAIDFDPKASANTDILIGVGQPPDNEWRVENILDLTGCLIARSDKLEGVFRDGMLFGPLLGYSSTADNWPRIAEAMDAAIHPEAQMIRFDSVASAVSAVEAGIGAALVPYWIANDLAGSGRIGIVKSNVPNLGRKYWLAVRREVREISAVDRFCRWLAATVADDARSSATSA